MRLQDKVAVITGGGQGIGRATARLFAAQGARVVIGARTEAKLAAVKAEIEAAGGQVEAVPTDVRKANQVQALINAAQAHYGGLDILVNNAGIGLHQPVDEADMEDYGRLLDTNLRGMYLGCKYAVPLLKERGRGAVINIASVHGVNGSPENSVYAATKGGIIGCTQSLAAELVSFQIRVNTVSPGAIWLEMYEEDQMKQVAEEDQAAFGERFGGQMRDNHRFFQPLEQVGTTDDIAYCVLYLASDEARFVTGQNIVVDGGLTTYLSPYAPEGAREKSAASQQEMEDWLKTRRQARGE